MTEMENADLLNDEEVKRWYVVIPVMKIVLKIILKSVLNLWEFRIAYSES